MATFEASDITKVFSAPNGSGGAVLPMLETPSGGMQNAVAGAAGGLAVEGVAGGTAVPVSGTLTIDAASLASMLAAPPKHVAIVKSDDTDLTELANVGVYVGGDGNLAYRTVGDPTTTVTLPVLAGQFVWGQFTRVMAATTATGLVGVSR